MATAADRKKWDSLHVKGQAAVEALYDYESELRIKYGKFEYSWLTQGQRNKLDRLRQRVRDNDSAVIDLLVRISPRGEDWLHGAPSYWLARELTWEDAIRPKNEPLSVVVPGSYGYPDGYVKEPGVKMARRPIAEPEETNDTHPDVEFAVNDENGKEHVFKTFNEAAGFALGVAASGGDVDLDVLIFSEEGAEFYGGDDALEQYNEDPEASVFERFEISVNNAGSIP